MVRSQSEATFLAWSIDTEMGDHLEIHIFSSFTGLRELYKTSNGVSTMTLKSMGRIIPCAKQCHHKFVTSYRKQI